MTLQISAVNSTLTAKTSNASPPWHPNESQLFERMAQGALPGIIHDTTQRLLQFGIRAAEQSRDPVAKGIFLEIVATPEYRLTALAAAAAYQNLADIITNPERCPTRTAYVLHGLRDCHVSALSVSALIGRVLHVADRPNEQVLSAARELFLTIPEDTGASDTPHNMLYEKFANHYSSGWQAPHYELPKCAAVAKLVRSERTGLSTEPSRPLEFSTKQSAESVRAGLELTVVSEFWNGAEYTAGTGVLVKAVRPRAMELGIRPEDMTQHLRYFWCHAGATELGHYNHALKALQALDIFRPESLRERSKQYLSTLSAAFEELANV